MPYEDMTVKGVEPAPEGNWQGPPTPVPPSNPEAIAQQAREIGGAAYRAQKHSWVPQADHQMAYGNGFLSARTSPYFSQNIEAERMVDMPNAGSPLGTEHQKYVSLEQRARATGTKEVGNEGGPKANRTNVLNTKTHAETTGEDPAPIFKHGQRGRA